VPRELETAFGFAVGNGREREPWSAPPAPPAPALGTHRVRACEVDSIGHVNNAVYLDLATQAALDAIEDAGWSLDRMLAAGSVPVLARADLEYLEGARYGDRLEIATWFAWAPEALEAHQRIARVGGERPLVRVSTRWRWVAAAGSAPLAPPDGVRTALGPLLAA
jgi:YbgC/YbaW family acyl-CoA thioester hydrolase